MNEALKDSQQRAREFNAERMAEQHKPDMSRLLDGQGMAMNPGHRTVTALHNQWPKLFGLLIHKFNLGRVQITSADIEAFGNMFNGEMPVVVAQDKDGVLTCWLTTETEALKLRAKEIEEGR